MTPRPESSRGVLRSRRLGSRLTNAHASAVLYEDNHCLAVAKPAPLLTQGVPAGLPTLEAWVKDYLEPSTQKPGNVYLGVPHRLDRPVSGVVLFARNSKAARPARRAVPAAPGHESLSGRSSTATWSPDSGAGTIACGSARRSAGRGRRRGHAWGEDSPPRVTSHRAKRGARLGSKLRPRTGRMHQLRVHGGARASDPRRRTVRLDDAVRPAGRGAARPRHRAARPRR